MKSLLSNFTWIHFISRSRFLLVWFFRPTDFLFSIMTPWEISYSNSVNQTLSFEDQFSCIPVKLKLMLAMRYQEFLCIQMIINILFNLGVVYNFVLQNSFFYFHSFINVSSFSFFFFDFSPLPFLICSFSLSLSFRLWIVFL